jgi:hypothetical protein
MEVSYRLLIDGGRVAGDQEHAESTPAGEQAMEGTGDERLVRSEARCAARRVGRRRPDPTVQILTRSAKIA